MFSSRPFTGSGLFCVAVLCPVLILGPPSSSSNQLCEYFIFAFHFLFFFVPPYINSASYRTFSGVLYLFILNLPLSTLFPPSFSLSAFYHSKLTVLHFLLLTIYYLLSTIHHLQLTIYYLLSVIYYLLFTVCYLLSTIYFLLFIHYYLLFITYYLLYTIYY